MLGLPTGFLREPLGPEDEDDVPAAAPVAAAGDDGALLSVGTYNPYFDWRGRNRDGLGYYRFYSQLQVLELDRTTVCIGVQALTPAGMQAGGRDKGPTRLSPSVAWFHDLGVIHSGNRIVGEELGGNADHV